MEFSQRLKEMRTRSGLTQVELAKKAGITSRSVQNYEMGVRKPGKLEIVEKLAKALEVPATELLDQADTYVIEAHEEGGSRAAKDIEKLVGEVTGLFAGGELSEEDLEGAMKALNDAYWIAKEKNKKYAPKKFKTANNK